MATNKSEVRKSSNFLAVMTFLLALFFIGLYVAGEMGFKTPSVTGVINRMTNVAENGQLQNPFSIVAEDAITPTPFQPVEPTATLSPACPEAGPVMPQYRSDEEGEHWFNSTVRWSPGMPLGIKFPELLIQQFGNESSRTPGQAEEIRAYVEALVKLGENLNPSLNWFQRVMDFLNAYINFGTSTCFRFPTEEETAVYPGTANWGLPVEVASAPVLEPSFGPDLTAPPNAPPNTSLEEVEPTQQVIVVDPNKPGQQTTWDWVPLGPPALTPTPDVLFELPPEQGPGITPSAWAMSIEEAASMSWIKPLVIQNGQCPDINLSEVAMVPEGDTLGITYTVDFSSWAEFYVGPCKKIRIVNDSVWVNQDFIQVGENKVAGFSQQVSVYVPPTSTPIPNTGGGDQEPSVVEIDLGSLAKNYGSSGIAADLSCNGDSIRDFGQVYFRNGYGTFKVNLQLYKPDYVGPCSEVAIVPEGEKPGTWIWGVDGMLLAGFKSPFDVIQTPVGPPAP